MRTMKILADSACDFAKRAPALTCVPMKITAGDAVFSDHAEPDMDILKKALDGCRGKMGTSCPTITDWLDAFADADDIICVTVTGGLAGSSNSACAAKNCYESEHKGKRVFVIDTLSAGPEMDLLLEKMAQWAEKGFSYEEICTSARSYLEQTGLLFMLKSLKNLTRSGKVSPAVATLARVAGLSIVGKADEEGKLKPLCKCRGEARALEALTERLEAEGGGYGRVRIAHCENEAAALQIKKAILAKHESASVEVYALGSICSFYAEKGGIMIGFEKTEIG